MKLTFSSYSDFKEASGGIGKPVLVVWDSGSGFLYAVYKNPDILMACPTTSSAASDFKDAFVLNGTIIEAGG